MKAEILIYHNPSCGTSRNTLAMLREAGVEPRVVEYLKDPPTPAELRKMIRDAGLSVREAIREKEDLYSELRLSDLSLSEAQLLEVMVKHPRLINRPFVVTHKGTRLCRPAEKVREILD